MQIFLGFEQGVCPDIRNLFSGSVQKLISQKPDQQEQFGQAFQTYLAVQGSGVELGKQLVVNAETVVTRVIL